MSDHPTTFNGESDPPDGIEWERHASLHRRAQGQDSDMLRGFNVLREGTFAAMIRHVASLPESDRIGLVIQKSGDRIYALGEIMALFRRDDFPGT